MTKGSPLLNPNGYGSTTETPYTLNNSDGKHPTTKDSPVIPEDDVENGVKINGSIDNKDGSATALSGMINLANTIVGAGMLGLPGAFGGTGYMGGIIILFVSAAFSAHGLVLLSKAAQVAGLPSSFYSVAIEAVPRYTILIDLAVALKCFGVATGYLITVADCMVKALDHILLNGDPTNDESFLVTMLLSRRVWVVGAVIAVLPVSFHKTMDALKKSSALALVFVIMLTAGIVAYANGFADPCEGKEGECRGEVVPFTDVGSTISKLPIFIFAFTCHQNIFPIVNEIQNRSQARLNFVIMIAIGFAFLVFLVVAVEGYLTYGSNVAGDILLNYPETGKVTFMRICIAFMLVLHYPLQLDPSRRCITSLIKVVREWMQAKKHQQYSEFSNLNQTPSSNLKGGVASKTSQQAATSTMHHPNEKSSDSSSSDALFNTITIAFLAASFMIAMIVDDLGVVLAMVGATGSTLVSYVLPGLIYIKIHPNMDLSKICAYVQLIMGCIIMPVALYFVLTGSASE